MTLFGGIRTSIKRALCAKHLTRFDPYKTEIFPVKVASRTEQNNNKKKKKKQQNQ